ncbi:MAG: M48 family metallopeptidase [Acidobacteriota bacterium]
MALFFTSAAAPLCRLPSAKLAQAIAFSHWRTGLYFGGTAWILAALWVLIRVRTGAAVTRLAERVSPRPWLQGLVVIPLWGVLFSAITVPLAIMGHKVSLHFGLSIERWPAWWIDWAKSTGLTLVLAILVLSILYVLLRRTPRRWWLWFWGITVFLEVVGAWAAPLAIDPLFNHFTPLAQSDPALVERLEQVAARGGLDIPPSRIFLMDASTRVTGANAYVTGLGASKRIVVWDTTLKIESPNEILFTYGHEQGHYVLHHVAKGIAWSGVIIFFFCWMAYRLMCWLVRRYGATWGIASVESWSSLGLFLLLAYGLNFLAQPVANTISRNVEHRADVYGQEVIQGLVPDARATVIHSFCSDALVWLDDPDPNRFVEFWTYSHPSTEQRADFAAHYDPWAPGQSPRYFRK